MFFEKQENGLSAELDLFLAVLRKFGMLERDKENCRRLIRSVHYDCDYDGIPFMMIYDEDSDTVSFSVSEENLKHRTAIAEYIRQLVEEKSKNIDIQ